MRTRFCNNPEKQSHRTNLAVASHVAQTSSLNAASRCSQAMQAICDTQRMNCPIYRHFCAAQKQANVTTFDSYRRRLSIPLKKKI
jgi:hypothetical protein